jgi:hypothetical protein
MADFKSSWRATRKRPASPAVVASAAGANRFGHTRQSVRVLVLAPFEFPDRLDLRLVAVHHRDGTNRPVVVNHIDDAPIGNERDAQTRDRLQRRFIIERSGEHGARFDEKALRFLASLALRDVARDAGKIAPAVFDKFAERNFERDLVPVAVQAGKFDAAPINVRRARRDVSLQPRAMHVAQVVGHQES